MALSLFAGCNRIGENPGLTEIKDISKLKICVNATVPDVGGGSDYRTSAVTKVTEAGVWQEGDCILFSLEGNDGNYAVMEYIADKTWSLAYGTVSVYPSGSATAVFAEGLSGAALTGGKWQGALDGLVAYSTEATYTYADETLSFTVTLDKFPVSKIVVEDIGGECRITNSAGVSLTGMNAVTFADNTASTADSPGYDSANDRQVFYGRFPATGSDTKIILKCISGANAGSTFTRTFSGKSVAGGQAVTIQGPASSESASWTVNTPVGGVTLNKSSLMLETGKTEKLTATVTPSNATNVNVSWSSSNTSAATVAGDGTVTAVAAGTSTITVTTAEGGKTASCAVTVLAAGDEEWKNKTFWRRSLVMRFTANWCGYCPRMATQMSYAQSLLPDRIEVVNFYADPDEFYLAEYATLHNGYGITGYPSMISDGRAQIPASYDAFSTAVNLAEEVVNYYPAATDVAFKTSVSGGVLSASINLYAKAAGTYKIVAMLVEDGITGYQENYYTGESYSYVHDNVARISLTSVSGDEVTAAANSVTARNYSVTVPDGCNTSNSRLLVYVLRPNTGGAKNVSSASYNTYNGYYVDNCRSESIGTDADLQYSDDYTLGKFYSSSSYSKDGSKSALQTHTAGNGIDVVITGDGFADKDMALFDTYASKAMEELFSEEPFKTYRNRFNVYSVKAVSENNVIKSGNSTKFGVAFGAGTNVSADYEGIFNFVSTAYPSADLTKTLIILIVNAKRHSGTCFWYSNHQAIAYCPIGLDDADFSGLVHHEAGGHGFGGLADEYVTSNYSISSSMLSQLHQWEAFGFLPNVDVTNNTSTIKWAAFLADTDYNGFVGIYEGGYYFSTGVYRPSEYSIMRYNDGGYNVASREAIYKNIMSYSETGWTYSYAAFKDYDAINCPGMTSAPSRDYKPRRSIFDGGDFVPTAPPEMVVVGE